MAPTNHYQPQGVNETFPLPERIASKRHLFHSPRQATLSFGATRLIESNYINSISVLVLAKSIGIEYKRKTRVYCIRSLIQSDQALQSYPT